MHWRIVFVEYLVRGEPANKIIQRHCTLKTAAVRYSKVRGVFVVGVTVSLHWLVYAVFG